MTTHPRPIMFHEFSGLIGKPYRDIQGFPLDEGWYAVVKGKTICDEISDLKEIPEEEAIIEDFVDAKGASHVKATIASKKRRRKMVAVPVSRAEVDYLASLLKQPSVRQLVGTGTPVVAIRKALGDLISSIERRRFVYPRHDG